MIFALALSMIATTGGALATYLYDDDAPLGSRLCSGACIGFAALGLVGFVSSCFLTLGPATLVISAAAVAAPFAVLLNRRRRATVLSDIIRSARNLMRNIGWTIFYVCFYVLVVVVMSLAFDNAMFERADGIFTGVLNNFGDLPFHLSVITRFAFGQNFPPEDPTYAGVRFTYPFLTDLVSAMFVRAGASLRDSMFIENLILAVAFVGVIHYWAWRMLRDRLAAILTPVLVVLSGGLGWLVFFKNAADSQVGLVGLLLNLPHSYTIVPESTWRWGNAMTSLLLTQRGILLGIPLAVIVFTQWWAAADGEEEKASRNDENGEKGKRQKAKGKKARAALDTSDTKSAAAQTPPRFPFSLFVSPSSRRMLAAGVVAGLLPLVHAHSFVVVMGVGAVLALGRYWRAWMVPLAALVILGIGIYFGFLPAAYLKIVLVIVAGAVSLGVLYLLPGNQRRLWLIFFLAALVIALPQLWWSTHDSAVKAGTFMGWHFGWDSTDEVFFKTRLLSSDPQPGAVKTGLIRFLDVLWFWLKNTGVFIPLLIAALVWKRGGDRLVSRRLLWFYLPFTLCFIIPNIFKMAPWVWDNVKVLFFWWVASAPLVALLIARLWQGGIPRRMLAGALLVALTLAGGLDVFALVTSQKEYGEFDRAGIRFSQLIRQQTPRQAIVLHAPIHNHPVFLTGRRSLMGYPGHIWTHGLEFAPRQSDIRQIYGGGPQAMSLLTRYGVDYVVVSRLEKNVFPINEPFFEQFTKIGESGEYRLFKVTP